MAVFPLAGQRTCFDYSADAYHAERGNTAVSSELTSSVEEGVRVVVEDLLILSPKSAARINKLWSSPRRRDFWLYADESQNFATEFFATFL